MRPFGLKAMLSHLYATVLRIRTLAAQIPTLSLLITSSFHADKAGKGWPRLEAFATVRSRHDSRCTLYKLEFVEEMGPGDLEHQLIEI